MAAKKRRENRRVKIRQEVNEIPSDECSFCLGGDVRKPPRY